MLSLVIGLIAIALAVTVVAAVRLRGARRAIARCRTWKLVTGRVIASSIREVLVDDVGTQYAPIVVYRYVLDDTQYESEHLTIGGHTQYSLRRNAERQLARYVWGGRCRCTSIRTTPLAPCWNVERQPSPCCGPCSWSSGS